MICKKCNIDKSVNSFHRDSKSKSGRKSVCKSCRSTRKHKQQLSNERIRFDKNLNLAIYRAIKENKSGRMWERILGFTLNDLKMHLENLFDENMTWDNYGSYWWINKIIPKSVYLYRNVSNNEFHKCWSLKNMIPVNKKECVRRKNTVDINLINRYNLFDNLPIGLIVLKEEDKN